MNWLARMFTIPRKVREAANASPVVHFFAGLAQAAAISSAQGVIDQHVSDPALAEILKAQIESEVKAHVPIPDQPGASIGDLLGLRPQAVIDPVAAGAENAGA